MFGQSKLPLLPGFTVHVPKENHHLSQSWKRLNGNNLLAEKKPIDKNWILNDGKILCFKAFFSQNLADTKSYQIRTVNILFYIEDGTIQVVEPRTDNSGIPQGCIVKRQLIPCSNPDESGYLTKLDFNVQKEVNIFDRIYIITDCDAFTRSYLCRAGIEVPRPIETPKDPKHLTREQMEESWQEKPKKPIVLKKLEKFLKFDNSCLKFDAYWDDRTSLSGDIHNLILYYYLCDDTIQICEIPKCGRPVILYKRLKLPKKSEDVLKIYQDPNAPLLNVIGPNFLNVRCMSDKQEIEKSNVEFYTDKDLKIGETVNLLGRPVILIDCDKFTRDFYQEKYGIEEFVPIEKPKDTRYKPICVERVMPPYNGWGSFEDSESNCYSIQSKPQQSNTKKHPEFASCHLRFKAEMVSINDDWNDRQFLITYYMSDDTISVFEIGQKEFLKRAKCYKPNQDVYTSHRPFQYTSQDFYVGAKVNFKGFEFYLTEADEFTLSFMEKHQSVYQMANISSIMSKVKEAIKPVYKDFMDKYIGVVPLAESHSNQQLIKICYETTAWALKELLGSKITEHEIITFLRYFGGEKVGMNTSTAPKSVYCRSIVQSMVQTEIANHIWDDVQGVKERIYELDPKNHNGFMLPAKLRTVIKSCRIPIKGILIDDMFSVLKKDSSSNIDVNDFLYFIDSNKYRAPPIQPISLYSELDKKAFDACNRPKLANWSAFISELGLETELIQQTN